MADNEFVAVNGGNVNAPAENSNTESVNTNPPVGGDKQPGSNVQAEKAPRPKGPRVTKKHRLHHSVGGSFTDFDSEEDLLDFVKDASTVKNRRNPDGSVDKVFSPNSHLVHGAAHPDYPNLVVSEVYEVEFPDDEDDE